MAENLVVARDLRVQRGDFLLQIDDWVVPEGCVLGLVGPNGAGKSTLLELLPGLAPVRSGTLQVFGRDPWADPAGVRQSLGFMTDDMPLFAMTLDRLLWTLSGYYPSWDAALVDHLVDRFKLQGDKYVHGLSKGQGSRLRVLLAMAHRPRLVVLDEPASGMDLGGRRALLDAVLEVVADPHRSVIISSHLLGDVERIADRLLVLDHGRRVAEGPTDELVREHQTLEEALIGLGAVG